jgi:hypothetical protein
LVKRGERPSRLRIRAANAVWLGLGLQLQCRRQADWPLEIATIPAKCHNGSIEVLEQSQRTRGRPPGARMPCGWHCGAELACTEMRRHFTDCSKRPKQRQSMTRARCGCCSAEYEFSAYAPTRLCHRCRSGWCWQCYSGGKVLDPNMKRGGRPPGPRMPCGWGCGAELTARLMRGHFTECSNRPGEFGHKVPADPKRG